MRKCSASTREPADARPLQCVALRLTMLLPCPMTGALMPSDPYASMKSVTTRRGRQLSRDLGRHGGGRRGLVHYRLLATFPNVDQAHGDGAVVGCGILRERSRPADRTFLGH